MMTTAAVHTASLCLRPGRGGENFCQGLPLGSCHPKLRRRLELPSALRKLQKQGPRARAASSSSLACRPQRRLHGYVPSRAAPFYVIRPKSLASALLPALCDGVPKHP